MDANIKTGGAASRLATAIALGCDRAHPTRIGGELYGYPDRRAVSALAGVDAKAEGGQVDRHGRRRGDPRGEFCGGYSWCVRLNPDVDPGGSTDPNADRVSGVGEEGCCSAVIDQVFIEVYPQCRDESAGFRTDFAHYGAASHYHQPIDPDRDNRVLLRLPLRFEQGGNTGDVNGYVTYRGRPVPDPERNLRIRALSLGRGRTAASTGSPPRPRSCSRLALARRPTTARRRWRQAAAARPPSATRSRSPASCHQNRTSRSGTSTWPRGSRKRVDFAF